MRNNDSIRDQIKKKLKRHGFMLSLLPALLPFIGYGLAAKFGYANLFAFTTVIVLYGVLPVLDLLIGVDPDNPTPQETTELTEDPYYRWLLWLNVPLAMITVAGGIYLSQNWHELNVLGYIGLVLSLGTVVASAMINAAHELIHRRSRFEQTLGGVLLSLTCYPSFKIEHLRGHHVRVATPEDQSTSHYGQTLYAFLPLALLRNFRTAWQLERELLIKRGKSVWSTDNELLRWYAFTGALIGGITVLSGPAGLGFFLLQSLTGITLLETINYLEHYGLRRAKRPDGRYERVTIQHSWNSNHLLSNLMTFQLQRHSDHHANPQRPYQLLRHLDESPQLPAGYSAMVLCAMLPPLWMKIMNPRVESYYQDRPELLRS